MLKNRLPLSIPFTISLRITSEKNKTNLVDRVRAIFYVFEYHKNEHW